MPRTKWTREECEEVLLAFYSVLYKPSGRNITETTFNIWRTHSNYPQDYLDCNKLANVRRDILKNNRLTQAEIELIKRKAGFEVQRSEKEIDDSQNITVNDVNDCQKEETADFYGRENVRAHVREDVREVVREADNIEGQDKEGANGNGICDLNFIEQNKAVLSQAKNDIIKAYAKVKNKKMKDRQSLVKVKNNKQTLKQIKIANYAMKEILEEFEPDLTELNQLIYAVAYVISSKTNNNKDKKHKLNKRKKPKWREKIESEIENFRGEISILKEISKGVSVKALRARKVIRKYDSSPEKLESLK